MKFNMQVALIVASAVIITVVLVGAFGPPLRPAYQKKVSEPKLASGPTEMVFDDDPTADQEVVISNASPYSMTVKADYAPYTLYFDGLVIKKKPSPNGKSHLYNISAFPDTGYTLASSEPCGFYSTALGWFFFQDGTKPKPLYLIGDMAFSLDAVSGVDSVERHYDGDGWAFSVWKDFGEIRIAYPRYPTKEAAQAVHDALIKAINESRKSPRRRDGGENDLAT